MPKALHLNPDRLFPADPTTRDIARALYREVADLPIISPHGHTDPEWFAKDEPFGNATELLLVPDHYLFRMLYSQGVRLEHLGIGGHAADPRAAWRTLAENFHLFRGTPSRMWLDWVFAEAFGIEVRLDGETADFFSTRSPKRCSATNSGLVPCSNAMASNCSRQRKARSIRLSIIARYLRAAGRAE